MLSHLLYLSLSAVFTAARICKHYNNTLYMLVCVLGRIYKNRAMFYIGQVASYSPHYAAMSMTSKVAMVTDHPSITNPYIRGLCLKAHLVTKQIQSFVCTWWPVHFLVEGMSFSFEATPTLGCLFNKTAVYLHFSCDARMQQLTHTAYKQFAFNGLSEKTLCQIPDIGQNKITTY